ncbi:MAG: hypothetical protein NZZ41_07960, partial [Candidatus Dojkabacteria bacterium]|nr:hypothetical protein [Candidatus Dojkabacteria bacterium]
MPITTYSKIHTIKITGDLASSAGVGYPKTNPAFLDTDGSTSIDGMLIPLIDPDRRHLINYTTIPVASVSGIGKRKLVVFSSPHGFVQGQPVFFTDVAGNFLFVDNVRKVI